MKVARIFLAAHLGALLFGLAGLLIVMPNLGTILADPRAVPIYAFGMTYAGSLQMVFGALAMFAFGVSALGWRRTLVFFGFAAPISLGWELLGTSTGYPFGNYAYTDYLGYKILDHVPFSIPLSWFYVGFACYLLGAVIADRFGWRARGLGGALLGVWFLTAWDLVLDPAMAHRDLLVKFWVWREEGPFFGMPIQNFLGWSITGLTFMTLARLAWRADPDPTRDRLAVWFPLTVYAANTLFAMAISASVGLWIPILLSAVLGLIPASLAWRRQGRPVRDVAGERSWRPLPTR